MKRKNIKYLLLLFVGLTAFMVLLYVCQMSDSITEDDMVYAQKILEENHISPPRGALTYAEQVTFIQQVQKAVEHYGYSDHGIPYNHARDLKDYYENPYGLCYDKSHAIEKILRVYNFQTRHVSIYYFNNFFERLFVFFIPNSPSHAASEVKTLEGWMYIDSIVDFVGIDADGKPMKMADVRMLIKKGIITNDNLELVVSGGNYHYVYGVYSRNGKLYPPYTFIPDYKLHELAYNLVD